mgnify:CR=1 FL=1
MPDSSSAICRIWVDADACPGVIKEILFRAAERVQVPLTLVRYQDDKPLTRRNKGPVWLLMPFSEYPEFDVSPIHSFMVWQLVRIEVIP